MEKLIYKSATALAYNANVNIYIIHKDIEYL